MKNLKRARFLGIGLVGWVLLLVGCGPVQSTQRISEAEVAVEKARVAEAADKAPYEYHRARQFLHKAKEEWGYSDFEAAVDYATVAKREGESALLEAKENPWEGPPTRNAADEDQKNEEEGAE